VAEYIHVSECVRSEESRVSEWKELTDAQESQ
jgi:hypothetical protein